MIHFGDWLTAQRHMLGFKSRKAFAEHAGLSPEAIQSLETSEKLAARTSTKRLLAQALRITLKELEDAGAGHHSVNARYVANTPEEAAATEKAFDELCGKWQINREELTSRIVRWMARQPEVIQIAALITFASATTSAAANVALDRITEEGGEPSVAIEILAGRRPDAALYEAALEELKQARRTGVASVQNAEDPRATPAGPAKPKRRGR
ncbi:MAG TPA: hypothetical protein VGN72_10005 [Tepidisphaeraceae bacterium]|jgi:transcriptional regulator with XRE-family HTH domain|nr:hypothetical protein [Tepidisphaeraceae bacterium]